MRYFATNFAVVLGAWRLRLSIDLEDDPEIRTLAMQQVLRSRQRARETATSR